MKSYRFQSVHHHFVESIYMHYVYIIFYYGFCFKYWRAHAYVWNFLEEGVQRQQQMHDVVLLEPSIT